MPEYMRIFAVADIAQTQLAFNEVLRVADRNIALLRGNPARRARAVATRASLRIAYHEYSEALDAAAAVGAQAATKAIIARIEQTRLRPETDKRKHLRDLIKSRRANIGLGGLATGAVGVADIDELNKAIDPDYPSKGTYWEAQEYGTSAHVGRVIQGFFHGGSLGAARPLAQLSGGGAAHGKNTLNSAFSPGAKFAPAEGAGSEGGKGGKGTILVPLYPRNFIRDGANDARDVWRTAIFAAEREAIRQLRAAV